MSFIVVYDACVLHPAPLRDLLVRIGATGVVGVKWTHTILDECFCSILKNRPDLNEGQLSRTRELMKKWIFAMASRCLEEMRLKKP